MKTETVINTGIACRTKNEIDHKAFEAACVAAGYKKDKDPYEPSCEYSYLNSFSVTQTDKDTSFKEVPLKDVLFCPSIAPDWAVDVRTSGRQFFWTDNKGRFREIFAGDHEGSFLDRAWRSVEMEIIAKRPQTKPEEWIPEVGTWFECDNGSVGFKKYFYVGNDDKGMPIVHGLSSSPAWMDFKSDNINIRPIKTEREKFIEEAGSVFGATCDIGALYDAGCRFVENKK